MKTKKWNELRAKVSPERDAKIRKMTQELAEQMPLNELRKALKYTQEQIAAELEISQASVSKMERQPDMFVKTLERFVKAMGGRLDVRAVFPQGEVQLTGLGLDDIPEVYPAAIAAAKKDGQALSGR